MNAKPLVSIVIVNYRNADDTIACLRSLALLDYPNWNAVIVDNNSSDSSVARIRAACPDVMLIESPSNRGFAGGCNLGLEYASANRAQFAWLLNSDAIPKPEALRRLVQVAEENPRQSFYGSWIVFESNPERLWFAGGSFNWWTGSVAHEHYNQCHRELRKRNTVTTTNWITACSMLVRLDSVRQVGLMDETYFLYREELEWQLRASGCRPEAILVNEPLVSHKVGSTTGGTGQALGAMFMSRNYLKLALKHGFLATWMLRWTMEAIALPLLRGRWRLVRAAFYGALNIGTPGERLVTEWMAR